MKILGFWIFQSWILKAKINNGLSNLFLNGATLKSKKTDLYSETDIFKKYFDSSLVFGMFFEERSLKFWKVVFGVKYYST